MTPTWDARFSEQEKPTMPGGPYVPGHPLARRTRYFLVGITAALLGTLGNGLVSTNLNAVAGEYGLYSAEGSWLTIAYTGMSAGSCLLVIKGRVQFGVDRIFKYLLAFYILAATAQLLIPGFATAVLARSANGLVTSTGIAMSVYYLLEALPPARRSAAVVVILGTIQVATPLARMVPVDLLTVHTNLGQRLLDLAIPLVEFALVLANPLPPTPTYRVLERLDVLTVALLLPALLLLVAVLALGRAHWWFDAPWLGWLLVFAVPLFALGLLLELGRASPALDIRWMGGADLLRFAAIAFLERIAAAEQSYGAVGLLSSAGLDNDQLHGLFAVVGAAMLAGIVTAALTLGPRAIPLQVGAALLLIAVASWIDSFSNGLTRMHQLLATQAMVGFGTTLFVGPALVWGLLKVMRSGPRNLLSLIMVFSFTQNIGSLTGSALLSSYQYARSQAHGRVLADSLDPARPEVAARIAEGARTASAVAAGSGAADAVSASDLVESADGQANILGFIDTFRLVTIVSIAGMAAIAATALWFRFNPPKKGRTGK